MNATLSSLAKNTPPAPSDSRNTMIRTKELAKHFDGFVAVKSVNLHVRAGEVLALLGPNGAGKTTTVRMLASILQPTRGQAWIDGHDVVQDALVVRHLVGVLTETPGLYSRMKAREYIDFFGDLQGMDKRARVARGEQLMAQFGMDGVWNLRLGEYSKGMRQKMALIRTMLSLHLSERLSWWRSFVPRHSW